MCIFKGKAVTNYFFLAFMAINTIMSTTAITKKIPKPIPALNMPAIASQELSKNVIANKPNTVILLKGFIFFWFEILFKWS